MRRRPSRSFLGLDLDLLPRSRFGWLRLLALVLSPLLIGLVGLYSIVSTPGQSHEGPPGPLPESAAALPARLRGHVERLADEIGPRSEVRAEALGRASEYITEELAGMGYRVSPQVFQGRLGQVWNLVAEVRPRPPGDEIVVVGAHYDTVDDTPGADDNASGVAAMLELARAFSGTRPKRTLRFIAFVNEEPPSFQTETMGSVQAALASAEKKERLVAMFSLETLGYYDDTPGSQVYPWPLDRFYPDTGNFIAFVGNMASRPLVQRSVGRFREVALLPSEGSSAPGILPGVGWSDHWSYWQRGYPAVMVTDTAPYRNRAYHTGGDRPDRLDYTRMAWVVVGLRALLEDLTHE